MEFIDNLYDDKRPNVYREACRGIIFKDNKLLMVYCEYFNDYSFSGGGLEKDEDKIVCLKRELEEELGVIVDNVKPFCELTEKTMSMYYYMHNFVQKNYFFTCDVVEEVESKLEDYEKEYGFQKSWISIDDAILHNSKVLQMVEKYKNKYILKLENNIKESDLPDIKRFGSEVSLKRDLYVLELLKEKYNERF